MQQLARRFFLGIAFFVWAVGAYASAPVTTSIAPMLTKVLPAVVNVSSPTTVEAMLNSGDVPAALRQQMQLLPPKKKVPREGSGVIINAKKGLIVTNAHVVTGSKTVKVTLHDRRVLTAKVLGHDKATDIALLQVKAKDLLALPMGNSTTVKVGDFVAAIGNPFGLGETVTTGVISAKGRNGLNLEGYEDFLQTDASINPGNSGGALVSFNGKLLGINTAILSPSGGNNGIGFAIPVNMVRAIVVQLEHGNVTRGSLGVYVQTLTPTLATAFQHGKVTHGALISAIVPHSMAATAGLHVGDIVTSVDGTSINSANDFRNILALRTPGHQFTIVYWRDGKQKQVKVATRSAKAQTKIEQQVNRYFHCVTLQQSNRIQASTIGDIQGLRVVQVQPGCPADNQLRENEIILSANGKATTTFADLAAAVKDSKQSLLLRVFDGHSGIFIVLKPGTSD